MWKSGIILHRQNLQKSLKDVLWSDGPLMYSSECLIIECGDEDKSKSKPFTHTPFSPLPLIRVFAVSVFEHPAHEDESQSYFSSHLDFLCSSNNISRSHFQISARTTFRFPLSAMDFLSVRVKYSSLCSVFSPVISGRRSKTNKNQIIWYTYTYKHIANFDTKIK